MAPPRNSFKHAFIEWNVYELYNKIIQTNFVGGFRAKRMASFTERNFIRTEKLSISNEEKRQLGELVKDFKAEYDIVVVQNNGKTKDDEKRRKHVLDLPRKRLCFPCGSYFL